MEFARCDIARGAIDQAMAVNQDATRTDLDFQKTAIAAPVLALEHAARLRLDQGAKNLMDQVTVSLCVPIGDPQFANG